MSYTAARAVVETHLTAAGTVVDPAIGVITYGELTGNQRRIEYFYLGSGSAVDMGGPETLTDAMKSERLRIRVVLPVADRSSTLSTAIEDDLQALAANIRHRLVGDRGLGGTCTVIDVGHSTAGWINYSESWGRTADIDLAMTFVDEDPIAL